MDHDQLICMHSKSKAKLNEFYPSTILSNFLHYLFKFLMKTNAIVGLYRIELINKTLINDDFVDSPFIYVKSSKNLSFQSYQNKNL